MSINSPCVNEIFGKRLITVNVCCVFLVFCLYFTHFILCSLNESYEASSCSNHVLNFWHLKPYVPIWFVLIKKMYTLKLIAIPFAEIQN